MASIGSPHHVLVAAEDPRDVVERMCGVTLAATASSRAAPGAALLTADLQSVPFEHEPGRQPTPAAQVWEEPRGESDGRAPLAGIDRVRRPAIEDPRLEVDPAAETWFAPIAASGSRRAVPVQRPSLLKRAKCRLIRAWWRLPLASQPSAPSRPGSGGARAARPAPVAAPASDRAWPRFRHLLGAVEVSPGRPSVLACPSVWTLRQAT